MRTLHRKPRLRPDRVIEIIGIQSYQSAIHAAESVSNIRKVDWPALLDRAATRADLGNKLLSAGEKLLRGSDIDTTELGIHIAKLSVAEARLKPMTLTDPEDMPLRPTGWLPLDTHIGGIPDSGLTVIGAPPGTGKTSAAVRIAECFARDARRVGIFTLEMTAGQMHERFIEATDLTPKQRRRYIYLCDEVLTVDELAAIAGRADGLDLIIIDFAELLIDEETSESVMAHIYRTLAMLAKTLGIPIVLLSQLNRSYQYGLPTISMLRNTGMAEALAALIILLHNPQQIYIGQPGSDTLPPIPGKAYMIVGKSRFGFKRGTIKHKGPGAILVDFRGEQGWGYNEGRWTPLGAI